MRVLLAGASGYVGNIIRNNLEEKYEIIGVSQKKSTNNLTCNLTNINEVEQLAKIKPDVIIHAAGNKNIQYCEDNPVEAYKVNALSLKNIASVFQDSVRIIYLSSDYVFDGERGNYCETDTPNPLTEYGKSKLDAEKECLTNKNSKIVILRVSALYDLEATFPKFLLENFSKNKNVKCYSDVFYSPTYYEDFINILNLIISKTNLNSKIYHSCGERMSRYDFAKMLCHSFGYDESLVLEEKVGENNKFLFHDISLNNEATETELNVRKMDANTIFNKLKKHFICK